MRDLRVTLVQANQIWEDKQANLEHFSKLLEHSEETDLILFPEMFHTAFTMNGEQLAETMEDSMALEWLKKLALEKQAAVYTSFIAKENGRLYNRGIFVRPTGEFSIYDKRKTFGLAGEDKVFDSGKKECIVDYLGWKINLQICYDLRFPENVRNGLLDDGTPRYDVLLYVANWPERRSSHWKALLQARAIENQCYVVAVNRVGEDANGLQYTGDSMIVHASGEKGQLLAGKEMVSCNVLNFEELQNFRERLPFLNDSDYRLFNN